MAHEQVSVKVNASVDDGVAPLVSALSRCDLVQTVDSCEGQPSSEAYVYFTYDASAGECTSFVESLSRAIAVHLRSCCDYSLQMEWIAGAERPLVKIATARALIPKVARAVASALK